MEENITTRLIRSEGRRFAFTLATAFALIALIGSWTDREKLVWATWTLAAVLLLAGLTVPGMLGPVERAWTRFGILLSRITSPVVLGIVYFVVFTPAGFVRRIMGKNSIVHLPQQGSYWKIREPSDPEARRKGMERQF